MSVSVPIGEIDTGAIVVLIDEPMVAALVIGEEAVAASVEPADAVA